MLNFKRILCNFENLLLLITALECYINLHLIKIKKIKILMTIQQINNNLNVENIKAKSNCTDVHGEVLIDPNFFCEFLYNKFRKHLKVFDAEGVYYQVKFIGSSSLI